MLSKEILQNAYRYRFETIYAKKLEEGNLTEQYLALASLIKDYISRNIIKTEEVYRKAASKEVYYFCIEFLPGRFLENNLVYLGLYNHIREALAEMGIDLEKLKDQEEDPGLGSGGLGRLAAGFLDSLACLGLPGHGMGIRYQFGLFEQKIINGNQTELPDNWLEHGYPWEYRKPEEAEIVKFCGNVRAEEQNGRLVFIHENYEPVLAVPYDIPIAGYQNETVNVLRLWKAQYHQPHSSLSSFCHGDYLKDVEKKCLAEAISQHLYPEDSFYEGKKLRLKQEYFFVSAGLQSIIKKHKQRYRSLLNFHELVALHINDTHPALVIPELMRILLDEEGLKWEDAWHITTQSVSYTNHTTLPEALEKWPYNLYKSLLPRIFLITEEIHRRFCEEHVAQKPGCLDEIKEMGIIGDGFIRMANLAVIGSHQVNGVSSIHTEILKNQVMNCFQNYYPYKFNNKTNGISQRRWLLLANPELSYLLTDTIGTQWIEKPEKLLCLLDYQKDSAFLEKFIDIKEHKKRALAHFIGKKYGIKINPESLFDVQVKRIHAYKRQLLNVFQIMHVYNRLLENPELDFHPRTFIFAGKAASGYYIAKKIIKLIHALAEKINHDTKIKEKIKVVFLENYNVSLAELVFPAANVSEQLSMAGKEASGTGNMKFMMNGAVTIGTLDGANIEILEKVGPENFISFGLNADEVSWCLHQPGGYRAWDLYNHDQRLRKICDQLVSGFLTPAKDEFSSIFDYLLHHNDEYLVLKDFASYVDAHQRVEREYLNRKKWARMCITNIAHSGAFSSDRSIREYAEQIWHLKPVNVEVE